MLELFECDSENKLYDAADDLALQNDILPSMKYFGCKLLNLPSTFESFSLHQKFECEDLC